MTYGQALEYGQRLLKTAGIGTARLDALVLLEDNAELDRVHILAHPELELAQDKLKNYQHQIARRAKQEPLAYIRKRSEFYGRDFYIDQRVLEPRPESEAMIEELDSLLKQNESKDKVVIDIGTGSGALIISAKLSHPEIKAYATDISNDCINVAEANCQSHKVDIHLYAGDLLSPLPKSVLQKDFYALANLPYVPDTWQINAPAMREPSIAIFGGKDGLRLYEKLFHQLKDTNCCFLLCESMPPQHIQLSELAAGFGYELIKTNDFIQLFNSGQHRA
jgi:release factor glutamine methyltransferase